MQRATLKSTSFGCFFNGSFLHGDRFHDDLRTRRRE
jgi:hypothetical protein